MNCLYTSLNNIIGGRFDYNSVSYLHDRPKDRFQPVPLSDLLLSHPKYGIGQTATERKNDEETRYLCPSDITVDGQLTDSLGMTTHATDSQRILHDGDILIVRSGNSAGKAYIHDPQQVDYSCSFSDQMICLTVDSTRLSPGYLFALTHLSGYGRWLQASHGSLPAQKITADDLLNLSLPLPPMDIQKDIAEKFSEALRTKLSKEKEAKSLTDGIDGYVYDALGIKLDRSATQEPSFTISLSDIIGNRIDVPSYREKAGMTSNRYTQSELASIMREVNDLKKGKGIGSLELGGIPHYILEEVRARMRKAHQIQKDGEDHLEKIKRKIESILTI